MKISTVVLRARSLKAFRSNVVSLLLGVASLLLCVVPTGLANAKPPDTSTQALSPLQRQTSASRVQPHTAGQSFFIEPVTIHNDGPWMQRSYNSDFIQQHPGPGLGRGWTSNLHVRLRPDTPGYVVIRLAQGESRLKVIAQSMSPRQPARFNSNIIIKTGDHLEWQSQSGVKYRFKGGLPVEMSYPDGTTHKFFYKQNRLAKLVDQHARSLEFLYHEDSAVVDYVQTSNGQRTHFIYDNGYLTDVVRKENTHPVTAGNSFAEQAQAQTTTTDPIQTRYRYTYTSTEAQSSQSEAVTTAITRPSSTAQMHDHRILLDTTRSNSTFVDIRPAGCNSYFDLPNAIVRGREIEEAMAGSERYATAQSTNHWFPAIDFVVGRTAVAQISRDLSLPSYNNPDNARALLNRLMREGRMINQRFIVPLSTIGEVSATAQGMTSTITSNQVDHVRFELVVQRGELLPHHLLQIEQARLQLLTRFNIQLVVVSIP